MKRAATTCTRVPAVSASEREARSLYLRLVYSEQLSADDAFVGRIVPFGQGLSRSWVIGRSAEDDHEGRGFALPHDRWASRRHARVSLATGERSLVVEDLGARNGTFLDGHPVVGREPAVPGQVLRVGGALFVVASAPLIERERVVRATRPPDWFVPWSYRALKLWSALHRVAQSDAGVLLTGEMGTGKTRLAEELHALGRRRGGAFVPFNCSSIPHNLEEATLFGVVGGFIPTVKEKRGWLTIAKGGTLFLDELADMPMLAQSKLLDAFDTREGSYVPVGGTRRLETDCRIVSATNRDVYELARTGVLRHDLLSRLVTAQIKVPALRKRTEDLLELMRRINEANGAWRPGRPVLPDAEVAEAALLARWVENVRGLESFAKRLALGEAPTVRLVRQHADRGLPGAHDESTEDIPVAREPLVVEVDLPTPEAPRPAPHLPPPPALLETGKHPAQPAPRSGPPAAPPPAALPWPPTTAELLTTLARHDWNVKEAAVELGRRRETVSRHMTKLFGRGARQSAQRAWRVWQASGRVPEPADTERLFALYFERGGDAETMADRFRWQEEGVLPAV